MSDDHSCQSGFPHDRLHFTAGADETKIDVPTFVGLRCPSNKYLPQYYVYQTARAYKRSHKVTMPEAMKTVVSHYEKAVAQYADDGSQMQTFGTAVQKDELPAGMLAVQGPATDPLQFARKTEQQNRLIPKSEYLKNGRKNRLAARRALPASMVNTGATAGDYSMSVDLGEYIQNLYRQPWLGVLYDDQLNFQPCGPVLGGMAYSLGLSPLETVTLRTKSWTKRETKSETSTEVETETTQELSSEWSSTISDRFAEEWRQEMKFNLSPKLGGSYEGFEASISESLDLSAGNTQSAEQKIDRTQKTSRSAALRAKKNHKTSFTVTSEAGFEDENTRVVQNPSPDRTMQLRYYNVLEKQKVSLERRGAHMALRLCLDDPVATLRDQVIAELSKLNPQIGADEGPTIPDSWNVEMELMAQAPEGWEIGNAEGTFDISVDIPANHVLSSLSLEFVRAIDEDGNEAYTDLAAYQADGGSIGFLNPVPTAGASGALVFKVHVNFAEPSFWWNGSDTDVVEMKLKIGASPTTEFGDQAQQNRDDWIEAEIERRKKQFSLDKIGALVDTDALLKDVIWAEVLQRFFLSADFWSNTEPSCDKLVTLENWFRWDLGMVQFLPWWMSPKGHENQQRLTDLIPHLDPQTLDALESWPFLASPAAVVYLPIRRGSELDVLAQITGGPLQMITPSISGCVQAFDKFYDDNFGSADRPMTPLPTKPSVCQGTPLGATEWATDWEKPRTKGLLLDEWFETMPTDGLHVEAVMGDCRAVSARKAAELDAATRVSNAAAELDEASAQEKRAQVETPSDTGE